MTAPDYSFSADDRASLDRWLQAIPSGTESEAMLQALRLIIRHDLADTRMAVVGYEGLLRQADATMARMSDLISKFEPLIARVEIVEARLAHLSREQAALKDQIRAVARDVQAIRAAEASGS